MKDDLTLANAVASARTLVEVETTIKHAALAESIFKITYGCEPPTEVRAFIGIGLTRVGEYEFLACDPATRDGCLETWAAELAAYRVFPVMSDGCGNLHGVYLDDPADFRVYFFEAMDRFARPTWVSASSIPHLVVAAARVSRDDGYWGSPDEVLAVDPFLTTARGAVLPWMAD